ncbi:hypothetical protein QLL95_gp0174 [Cotonvirus japonicus]|uniref:Uncharacterized protein n=1 Tax=Cotonvirus japonicus TaxID=2811091 RepID=A0ABM7NR72_9VIRU|nr:hypothetical protein QLL95_gp0174 [Cotonvirus japonicus]BCS82663.1 hypothetical protein [Cotonvirus japonicus]
MRKTRPTIKTEDLNFWFKTTGVRYDSYLSNCEEKIKEIKSFDKEFDIDYSGVELNDCQCPNVLEFLLEKPEVQTNINKFGHDGSTPLFSSNSIMFSNINYLRSRLNGNIRLNVFETLQLSEQIKLSIECSRILENFGGRDINTKGLPAHESLKETFPISSKN